MKATLEPDRPQEGSLWQTVVALLRAYLGGRRGLKPAQHIKKVRENLFMSCNLVRCHQHEGDRFQVRNRPRISAPLNLL